jgi:hypothetical protein
MNKDFDLAILGWEKRRAIDQCKLWNIGIYPRPYRKDGINALVIIDTNDLINLDLDIPVVIIRLPDGTIPTTFDAPITRESPGGKIINPAYNAALQAKARGNNYFEFDGDVTIPLSDILKKRIKVINVNGKREWVVEEGSK